MIKLIRRLSIKRGPGTFIHVRFQIPTVLLSRFKSYGGMACSGNQYIETDVPKALHSFEMAITIYHLA